MATQVATPPTTVPTPISAQSGKATIIADTLNIRAGPSKNYPVIGKLKKGTVVEVTGVSPDKEFYRIRWVDDTGQTRDGWISANPEYVDADDAAKQAVVIPLDELPATSTPISKPTEVPVPTPPTLPEPTMVPPQPTAPSPPTPAPTSPLPAPVPTCCRVCREGKPCGDACISLDKECHQPSGCACWP